MSQRFTVSKSDGDRRPSDIQGEVNQLFEGDEPPTSSGAEGEDAAGAEEVVVVLKGRLSLTRFIQLAIGYKLAVLMPDACSVAPHCPWTDVCDWNLKRPRWVNNGGTAKRLNAPHHSCYISVVTGALLLNNESCMHAYIYVDKKICLFCFVFHVVCWFCMTLTCCSRCMH